MPTWSFADEKTGEFTGQQFSGPDEHLPANLPPGTVAVEGTHDPLTTRYNLQSETVEEFASPQAQRLERERNRERLDNRLAELESRTLRALRELAINPNDGQARQRLIELDQQAAGLRERVRGNNGPP